MYDTEFKNCKNEKKQGWEKIGFVSGTIYKLFYLETKITWGKEVT